MPPLTPISTAHPTNRKRTGVDSAPSSAGLPTSPSGNLNRGRRLFNQAPAPKPRSILGPPVQDLPNQCVRVHWDRGINIGSAGLDIINVLKKIWGAERQLRAKQYTLDQRRETVAGGSGSSPKTHGNKEVLMRQSVNEITKWEEILDRHESELDGLVFKRYQLVRVSTQRGRHAPRGQGRVYLKAKGYTLPEVKVKVEEGEDDAAVAAAIKKKEEEDGATVAAAIGVEEKEEKEDEDDATVEATIEGSSLSEIITPSQSFLLHDLAEYDSSTAAKSLREELAGHNFLSADTSFAEDDSFQHDSAIIGPDSDVHTHDIDPSRCLICSTNLVTGIDSISITSNRAKNSLVSLDSGHSLCLLCLVKLWERYGWRVENR